MLKVSHDVMQALVQRRDSVAKQQRDGNHIALVVEGGGMRGVAAGGMVTALENLGMLQLFDSVHGSSAGAAAAAYFAVGRAAIGTTLYYEDLNDGRFISRSRALFGKPILDSSFLVDFAMVKLKPFDFQRLSQGRPRLHIATTDIDAGEAYVISEFGSYEYYREALKASISLPLIAGKERHLDGRRLLDGGLLQQIPLRSAEVAGATHIVALVTRGEHELRRPLPTLKTKFESFVLQKMYGGKVGQLYEQRSSSINDQVDQLVNQKTHTGVPITSIGLPPGLNYVHRLTTDSGLLKRAADEAFDYTKLSFEAISQPTAHLQSSIPSSSRSEAL